MASTMETFFLGLDKLGVTDGIIPFILIFVLVFAVLQKSRILGTAPNDPKKPNKSANVVVALVMAFSVVIPHFTHSYPPGKDIVEIMNTAIPNISVVVVAIVMLLLILGIWGDGVKIAKTPLSTFAVWIAIIAVVASFGSAAGWFGSGMPWWLDWIDNAETQSMVIIVLVFALVIWLIVREPGKDDPKRSKLGDVIVDDRDRSKDD